MPEKLLQWSCGVLRTFRKRKCALGLLGLIVIMMQLLDVMPPMVENGKFVSSGLFQRPSSAAYFKTFPSWLDTDVSDNLNSANHHGRHIQGFYRGILGKFESYLPEKLDSDHDKSICANNCVHHHMSSNHISRLNVNPSSENLDSENTQIGQDSLTHVTAPSVFIPSKLDQQTSYPQNKIAQAQLYEQYYHLSIKTKDKLQELEDHGFFHYSYNVTASDQISINRQIPDTRPHSCPVIDTNEINDTVSIVIAVHNEARSVLIRTITSILARTDSKLLQQIIIVFDNESDTEFIKDYFKQEKIIVFLQTQQREGLVRSRLLGASQATGSVLVFLDSHCECNSNWLQPLLYSIAQKRNKIVSPYIDSIRPDTFEYVEAPANLQGGFNWHLEFIWQPIPFQKYQQRISAHQPISTPTISGGLFAVDRNYFFQLGSYDNQMDIWGGENMELSFRTWMCGGQLEILPCCRVGHVFRSILPHSFPDGGHDTVSRNLARVAETWMDEYKQIFYSVINLSKPGSAQDLTERQNLRENLNCKSFRWYLQNIIPELSVPNPHSLAFGEFRHQMSLLCLTVQPNGRIILSACLGGNTAQMFSLTFNGDLKLNNSTLERCIVEENKALHWGSCAHQIWRLKGKQVQLEDGRGLCLGSVDFEIPELVSCEEKPETQWDVTYRFKKPWK